MQQRRIVKPIIIIGCPRSGTSLLFTILSQNEHLWSLYRESRDIWERKKYNTHPSNRNWHSHVLAERDATPLVKERIREEFAEKVLNHEGGNDNRTEIRMVEKTPRSCFRISFINEIFPDALFVFLQREGNNNIHSLMEGWTYPKRFENYRLPVKLRIIGYSRKRWCFVLPPGWQEYIDKPLAQVCAFQWKKANDYALRELSRIESSRVIRVRYEDLTTNTAKEMKRVCQFAGIPVTVKMEELMYDPPVVNTTSSPKQEKWRAGKFKKEIESVSNQIRETMNRLGYDR